MHVHLTLLALTRLLICSNRRDFCFQCPQEYLCFGEGKISKDCIQGKRSFEGTPKLCWEACFWGSLNMRDWRRNPRSDLKARLYRRETLDTHMSDLEVRLSIRLIYCRVLRCQSSCIFFTHKTVILKNESMTVGNSTWHIHVTFFFKWMKGNNHKTRLGYVICYKRFCLYVSPFIRRLRPCWEFSSLHLALFHGISPQFNFSLGCHFVPTAIPGS